HRAGRDGRRPLAPGPADRHPAAAARALVGPGGDAARPAPLPQELHDLEALRIARTAPERDLAPGAQAALAQAGVRIEPADADAGRGDLWQHAAITRFI